MSDDDRRDEIPPEVLDPESPADPEAELDEDGEDSADDPDDELDEEPDEDDLEDEEDDGDETPPLPPLVSVGVVGVLCGFATFALVWLGERLCVSVRDSPNCGPAGFPMLVVVVILVIVLAHQLLRRLLMPSPGLVAFLGVAFMLLVVVGVLSDRLFTPWSMLVVPAISLVTFVLAHLLARRLGPA